MAAREDFLIVQKCLFDRLRQHCDSCPNFSEPSQDLLNGRVVVIPYGQPGQASGRPQKKRKTLHGSDPPESSSSQRKKYRGRHAKEPRKNEAASWFLRNVPKAVEWSKRQNELGLNSVGQYEEVIRAFVNQNNVLFKREPGQKGGDSENELVDLAERFALLTKSSLNNANLQRSFANFQATIFLSYCEVLRKRGIPYETVDQKIQHITKIREYDRRRLLDSAKWINKIIFELVGRGWTIYRATELFFINALSLTYLANIHNDENLQSILDHLKADEFVKYDYSDCLGPQYTIPGLIASLLDANNIEFPIDEIYTNLGCNVSKPVEGIYKVHAARQRRPVIPVNPDFVVLIPDSFQSNDELAPNEGASTTGCQLPAPERALDDFRHSCGSSATSVPGNQLRNPLRDVVSTDQYMQCCSVRAPSSAQSPSTLPTSSVISVSAAVPSVSWDERFQELQQASPDSARFLTFLCSLRPGDIPEILFHRIRGTRECWACDGEIKSITISVNDPLIDLLTHQTQFEKNVQLLESFGFVKSEPGALGKRNFSIKPDLQERITNITPNLEELEWLRLVLICHSFPGRLEEIGFGDTARTLVPQLQHAFTHCQGLKNKILTHHSAGYSVLLALLLSSKLLDRDWKQHAVELAEEILQNRPQFGNETLYLRMFARQRGRDISRRFPSAALESAYEELVPSDPRTNALYGEHLRSNAQDRIMEGSGDLDGALEELKKFEYFQVFPSTIEKQEKDHHLFIEGKIYRWKGFFHKAGEIFYQLLDSRQILLDETGCSITCHYIAALCEQRQMDPAETIARQAVTSCKNFDEQGLKRQGLKIFRSLQLSLAETLVCRALIGRVDGGKDAKEINQWLVESECMYENLKEEYELIKRREKGTWSSEFEYLRVCIGRALVSHMANRLPEAHDRWEDARKPAEVCKDKVTRFIPMIIDYCDCDINMKLDRVVEAEALLRRAKSFFGEMRREHWWTGLGTFLVDFLKTSIPESGVDSGREIMPN